MQEVMGSNPIGSTLIEQTRVAKFDASQVLVKGTAARGRFPLVPVLKLKMMKANIEKKIESMIIEELDRLNLGKRDADKVRQYRDTNFLGGHYDHLFEKYIEDKELED